MGEEGRPLEVRRDCTLSDKDRVVGVDGVGNHLPKRRQRPDRVKVLLDSSHTLKVLCGQPQPDVFVAAVSAHGIGVKADDTLCS